MKMEEAGDDKDDSKRRTRNLSEKKRRDQFNMLVNELSSMVSSSTRKMDKSSILKSTISFLKNHNEITVRSRAYDVQEDWKPPFLANDEFTYLLMDALEGFLMVLSATGRILYVSDSITALLGHNPAYLANTNLFDLTHPNDKSNLFELLQGYMHSTDPSQSISKDNEVRIEIHLKRGTLDFGTETSYELVTFNGHFRENVDQFANGGSQQNNMHDTRVLFICTGRLHTPHLIRDVSLVNFDRNEFTSRHSLEWKFLFLDHRAPPIIGYLPFEVLGTSGYDYYHFDDLEKVVACHEALMENGEVTSGYYRFLTKGQQWIWLQTRYFITYHQWNSKPEFVVCTHRVVSIADVEKSTKEGAEGSNAIELDSNGAFLKEASEDVMSNVSPSFISEGSSVFASSYQTPSEGDVSLRKIKDAPPDEVTMKTTSPSRVPQCNSSQQSMRDGHSDDAVTSFMSESGDPYSNAYRAQSKSIETNNSLNQGSSAQARVLSNARSVKSTTSAGTGDGTGSWGRNSRPPFGSDSGSLSGESSRTSSRRVTKEKKVHQVACFEHCNVVMYQQAHKIGASPLVPQHGIGAQFLDPAPYVGVGVVPLSTLPVIVAQNPADVQEQLQKKHEELQGMIERQQAELQQVKEQLLLARLGVIQPILNVQYVNAEEVQIDIAASALPQIAYPVANQPHLPLPSAPSHLCNPQ